MFLPIILGWKSDFVQYTSLLYQLFMPWWFQSHSMALAINRWPIYSRKGFEPIILSSEAILCNIGLSYAIFWRHECFKVIQWHYNARNGPFIAEKAFNPSFLLERVILCNIALSYAIFWCHEGFKVIQWLYNERNGPYIAKNAFNPSFLLQRVILCNIGLS